MVTFRTAPIEAAEIMRPDDGSKPVAVTGFRGALDGIPFVAHIRAEFNEAVRSSDIAIVVATGDVTLCACLLLTIGMLLPESQPRVRESPTSGVSPMKFGHVDAAHRWRSMLHAQVSKLAAPERSDAVCARKASRTVRSLRRVQRPRT